MIDSAKLNRAIWSSVCTYCGAKPGDACKQKPRSGHPITKTGVPHMARVKAGHFKLTEQA